ncbi:2-hydroxy-3-keto-5-methylthiopentenyl-1-phosphate phosphatase [Bacillus sp. 31A1R]|uniref:2-hydroxy-3-keto-5-methylthiopentenyl-1-phosphate phosphatase n=1 Tax=Robertmurraya mangrovi TaxID=3098077 RepID=A0ABU5ITT9_9BACI|nr:2-hydroxy-3-keto-5-methylthiopentenyl-1-phosphate phosphatase [Bacillus sp. 31A1R]MDZ5470536.1 2-hydroxy-3-keto-5-methylthiopentenyl-1-phosphate phosphatase [Bacillus sp. 31A1R]
MKKLAVFCDFDGTITEKDNIIAIMKQFAPPEWETLKDDILSERISIREGVGKMFALLPSSMKEEINTFANEQAKIRAGFKEFVDFLKEEEIPLYIVSGGIDFFVHSILEPFGPFEDLYCNGSDFTGEYIKIMWPNSCDEECTNDCGCCKPSVIRKLEGDQLFKIVIGDSITDVEAAKQADFVLARDLLLTKCNELELNHSPFTTFYDCINEIKKLTGVRV